jgi:hypothetical protein
VDGSAASKPLIALWPDRSAWLYGHGASGENAAAKPGAIMDHLLLQVPILSPDQERGDVEYTLPRELLQYEPPIRWPKDRMIFQVVVTYRRPATKRA